jgi:hypothetical protein
LYKKSKSYFLYYFLTKGLIIKYIIYVISHIALTTRDSTGKRRSIRMLFPGPDTSFIKRIDIIRKITPVIIALRENNNNLLLFLSVNINLLIEIGIHMKNTKIKYQNRI